MRAYCCCIGASVFVLDKKISIVEMLLSKSLGISDKSLDVSLSSIFGWFSVRSRILIDILLFINVKVSARQVLSISKVLKKEKLENLKTTLIFRQVLE